MLGEGGLYHIYATLITADNDQNVFPPSIAPRFSPSLSVGDVSTHAITFKNNIYNITTVSYYDKIANYSFDPTNLQLSWSMPFDWNATRLKNQLVFVHEEVRVPTPFKEFSITPTYVANVNGNPIAGNRIIADPYSLPDTVIVHILLNKNDLINLSKNVTASTNLMNFRLAPATANVKTSSDIVTDFGGWEIKLGWSPIQIAENTRNDLSLQFSDVFSGQKVTGNVIFDLKILDENHDTILSETDQTAKNGSSSHSINLPNNGIYTIQVNIKSIITNGFVDTSRTGLARGSLVIPSVTNSDTIPEFPTASVPILISFVSISILNRIKIWSGKT